MSEITISTGHPDAGRIYAEALHRVTAERDAALEREAALREEVEHQNDIAHAAKIKCIKLQQRLTAADERVDVPEGLLRDQVDQIDLVISSLEFDEKLHGSNPERSTLDFPHAIRILSRVKAALKPAEGGSDEAI